MMTLTRFILQEQKRHPEARGSLSIVLSSIATAVKALQGSVRVAGLLGLYGLQGGSNSTGDEQKKLDVIADEIFVNSLRHTGLVSLMVSEEQEEVITTEYPDAPYIVVFDPLDGAW